LAQYDNQIPVEDSGIQSILSSIQSQVPEFSGVVVDIEEAQEHLEWQGIDLMKKLLVSQFVYYASGKRVLDKIVFNDKGEIESIERMIGDLSPDADGSYATLLTLLSISSSISDNNNT